jgi:5-hydroxyisourate hydrolase-like protein (transthyretin family)
MHDGNKFQIQEFYCHTMRLINQIFLHSLLKSFEMFKSNAQIHFEIKLAQYFYISHLPEQLIDHRTRVMRLFG